MPRKGASAPTDADDRFDDSRHPRRTLASNGKQASAIWAGVRGSRRASRTCALCECARQHVGAGWTLAALAFAHEQPPASAESAQMLCEGLRARGSSLSVLLVGTNLATPVKPISSCCFSRLRKSSPTMTADSASGRQICAIRTTGGVRLD